MNLRKLIISWHSAEMRGNWGTRKRDRVRKGIAGTEKILTFTYKMFFLMRGQICNIVLLLLLFVSFIVVIEICLEVFFLLLLPLFKFCSLIVSDKEPKVLFKKFFHFCFCCHFHLPMVNLFQYYWKKKKKKEMRRRKSWITCR